MRDFQGVKCPNCGKKGLGYATHPHALGWKDYERVSCRYCNKRFPAKEIENRPPSTHPAPAAEEAQR
jgi:DNA-directed RNA polymerase subunit RPC12/RpoP